MEFSLKVGIVGYGPASNVAAVALHKQGHRVTIFEKNPSPYEVDFETLKNRSYPLLFNTKASLVLERVGILPYFQNMKHCNHFLKIEFPNGEISIDSKPEGYQESWNGIMKSMLDSLRELCPDAEIHFNIRVANVDIQSGTLTTEKQDQHTFDLVLGCDGVGSVVLSCGET